MFGGTASPYRGRRHRFEDLKGQTLREIIAIGRVERDTRSQCVENLPAARTELSALCLRRRVAPVAKHTHDGVRRSVVSLSQCYLCRAFVQCCFSEMRHVCQFERTTKGTLVFEFRLMQELLLN